MDAAIFQLPWRDAVAGAGLLLRAAGFVTVAPVFGSEAVPAQVRVGLALLLVVLLAPIVPAPPVGTSLLWLVATESFVGLTLGFITRLVAETLLAAGAIVGHPTNLSMATMFDPINQTQVTTLSSFYQVLGMLVFLAIGGHRQVLAALARSYEILPAGGAHFSGPWVSTTVAMTGQVLSIGLRLAAPILVAGFLVDTCLMLVGRAVPQMNILIVGAPVRTFAGLAAIAFSLFVFAPIVAETVENSTRLAARFLQALARG